MFCKNTWFARQSAGCFARPSAWPRPTKQSHNHGWWQGMGGQALLQPWLVARHDDCLPGPDDTTKSDKIIWTVQMISSALDDTHLASNSFQMDVEKNFRWMENVRSLRTDGRKDGQMDKKILDPIYGHKKNHKTKKRSLAGVTIS